MTRYMSLQQQNSSSSERNDLHDHLLLGATPIPHGAVLTATWTRDPEITHVCSQETNGWKAVRCSLLSVLLSGPWQTWPCVDPDMPLLVAQGTYSWWQEGELQGFVTTLSIPSAPSSLTWALHAAMCPGLKCSPCRFEKHTLSGSWDGCVSSWAHSQSAPNGFSQLPKPWTLLWDHRQRGSISIYCNMTYSLEVLKGEESHATKKKN